MCRTILCGTRGCRRRTCCRDPRLRSRRRRARDDRCVPSGLGNPEHRDGDGPRLRVRAMLAGRRASTHLVRWWTLRMATTDKQSSRKWNARCDHARKPRACPASVWRGGSPRLDCLPRIGAVSAHVAVGVQDRCRVPASSRRTCSDELDGDAEVKLGPRVLSSHGRNTQSLRECKA